MLTLFLCPQQYMLMETTLEKVWTCTMSFIHAFKVYTRYVCAHSTVVPGPGYGACELVTGGRDGKSLLRCLCWCAFLVLDVCAHLPVFVLVRFCACFGTCEFVFMYQRTSFHTYKNLVMRFWYLVYRLCSGVGSTSERGSAGA